MSLLNERAQRIFFLLIFSLISQGVVMKQSIFAKWLLAITCTHFLLGTLIFKQQLLSMIESGWWNTVGPDNIHVALAAWFMLFTFPLGLLIANMWSQQTPVKKKFLYMALFGSIIIGLTMPASGVWSLTLLSVVALLSQKQQQAEYGH